jgi:hypothetical protein
LIYIATQISSNTKTWVSGILRNTTLKDTRLRTRQGEREREREREFSSRGMQEAKDCIR